MWMSMRHFRVIKLLTIMLVVFETLSQNVYAADKQEQKEGSKETIRIELTGKVETETPEMDVFEPTLEQTGDGVWTLKSCVGTTTVVYHTDIDCEYNINVISNIGNVNGKISKDGNMEIYTSGVGSGIVSFQYVNEEGVLIGAPVRIVVFSEERLDLDQIVSDYYREAVFCGDSIIVGLRNYALKNKDSFLNTSQYLAVGSYSLRYALNPDNPENLHPTYKGEKRVIWESISMMQPKRVFLFFGLNDLNIIGLEGTRDYYIQLVDKIKETNPDIEIHIISMTMTLEGTGKHNLQNDKIREFNEMMQVVAAEQGWGYVDIASSLVDDNGDLEQAYCSDGFIHHSRSAYEQVWTEVLRGYALQKGEK